MASGRYPFIDIAVHDNIRTGYADGDAQVVLARNVHDVLWVNGSGARLFGYPDPYAFMDEGLSEDTAAFRQIEAAVRAVEAAAGASTHRFAMRAGTGIHRPVIPVIMERIILGDGNSAFLLACKIQKPAVTAEEKAANILDGFEDMETLAAVLDDTGEIVGSTPSFQRLQMESQTRRAIVNDVARDTDRLVKHPVRTVLGYLPAAIARIGDDPALNLMFAIEMSIGNLDPEIESSRSEEPDVPIMKQQSAPIMEAAEDEPPVTPAESGLEAEGKPVAERHPSEEDDLVLPDQAPEYFVFDPHRRPVRFVWRVDADGVFKELSGEFAEAVGPNAADIIGRRFSDVALVFNLDPNHEIADLLQRRDTWSGKTVRWPVQGTGLTVPVDLAALPTYSRERVFDGFRGFGIIRCSDASKDPAGIGLALAGPSQQALREDVGSVETPVFFEAEPGSDGLKDDWQPSETPTPETHDTPDDKQADKVIKLEERRPKPREGLSSTEQLALREIAERLSRSMDDEKPDRPFGRRPNADLDDTNELSSKNPETGPPSTTGEIPETADHDTDPVYREVPEPAGRKISAEDLEAFDHPAVVHDGSTVFYANQVLLSCTGYRGVDDINTQGGLHALAGAEEEDGIIGPMLLHGPGGVTSTVSARLRSVIWEGRKALLLDFLPVSSEEAAADTDVLTDDGVLEPIPETAEDVDDSRRIADLQVEVEELRSILETATDGVVLLDHDGHIRSLNRSALALFDFNDVEARGKPFAFLFAHESQRAVQDYLTGLSDHGVASVLNDGREVIGREASGRFIPLFMTIGLLSGSNGYCAVMRDITHWKRTEEELRTAKRSAETASLHKTEFLARVSHEIRTPLNAIIGFSDLMAEERFGPIGSPRYVEYAGDIGRSGRHVLDIVNDLLDISKIEAGEQELDFQPTSLNQVLLDAVTILQPQANSQRVIIRTSLSSQLPNVVADPRSVKQIAINILSNAVRFTPPGGQAVVSSSYEKDGSAVVRIRDTGVGMTQHQLDEAMKPFRQVTASPRPRGEGTGLGLPLAKAMAEANRAEFSMGSEPGRGTLVEIRFPSQRVLAE